jgi:hypothetical protein
MRQLENLHMGQEIHSQDPPLKKLGDTKNLNTSVLTTVNTTIGKAGQQSDEAMKQ